MLVTPMGRVSVFVASFTLLLLLGGSLSPGIATATRPNLIAAYAFDQGSGEVAEDSAGSHDGAIEGPEWSEGSQVAGWGLLFDGVDDCVSVPTNPQLDLSEEFTLEAWINPRAMSEAEANEPQPIIFKEGGPVGHYSLSLSLKEAQTVEGFVGEGESSFTRVADPQLLGWNHWTHVALTHVGGVLRLYVGGELVASISGAEPGAGESPLKIGCATEEGHFFHGEIDEVRIYDRALTTEEITEDLASPVQPLHIYATGDLVQSGPEDLVSPISDLSVTAGGVDTTVDHIDLVVDGEVDRTIDRADLLDNGNEYCYEEYCSITYSGPADVAAGAAPGPHTFEIRAVDTEDRVASLFHEVILDVDGPDLVVSGALSEVVGLLSGTEADVKVQASDGEGVYASGVEVVEIYVDHVSQDAELPNCEEGCPTEATLEYGYSEEEWGTGPHEVILVALDGVGNESTYSLKINQDLAAVEPICSSGEPSSVEVEAPASPNEALEALEERLPGALTPNVPWDELGGTSWEAAAGYDPGFESAESGLEETDAFLASGGIVGGRVVDDESGGFTVGQALCMAPLQTTSDESEPSEVPDASSVLIANTAQDTDTLIRATGLGATVISSFRGSASPEALAWEATLGPNDELVPLSDGGVAVVNSEGVDLQPETVPDAPAGWTDPELISDVQTQLELATHELRLANDENNGEVRAVFLPAIAIDSEGAVEEVPLSMEPESQKLSVLIPAGSAALILNTASAPDPAAVCAAAFAETPQLYAQGCQPDLEGGADRMYVTGMDWSSEGDLVFSAFESSFKHYDLNPGESRVAPEEQLYTVTSDGNAIQELNVPGFSLIGNSSPSVSPDGSHLAFNGCSQETFKCGVVVANSDGSEPLMVYTHVGPLRHDATSSFDAAGARILFAASTFSGPSDEKQDHQLYSVKLNGSGLRQVTDISTTYCVVEGPCGLLRGLFQSEFASRAAAEPNAESLALENLSSIYLLPSGAEKIDLGEMEAIATNANSPAYSPDSSQIAYSADPSTPGGPGIYLMNADGSNKEQLVRTAAKHEYRGIAPAFSPDGSEVAYIRDGRLYKVPAAGGDPTLITDGDTKDVQKLSLAFANGNSEMLAVIEEAEAEMGKAIERLGGIGGVVSAFEEGLDVLKETHASEREFCEAGGVQAIECGLFAKDRKLALDMRGDLFTNRNMLDRSTRGNAFQHGFWTALMVRHSREAIYGDLADGLYFALIHEESPWSWDARQDLINDFVGYFWVIKGGIEEVEENVYGFRSELEVL